MPSVAVAGRVTRARVSTEWRWASCGRGLTGDRRVGGALAADGDRPRQPRSSNSRARSAPVVFVFGYLLILATFMHRAVPQFPIPLGGGASHARSSRCARSRRSCGRPRRQRPAHGRRDGARRPIDRRSSGASRGIAPCEAATAPRADGRRARRTAAGDARGSGVLAWLISWQVNLNEFSLHTFYRNRLVRCFLGASRKRDAASVHRVRRRGRPAAARRRQPTRPTGRIRPYPIFNAAINLVAGKNLAWQERKAASFVFTPEYCGFEYRDDDDPPAERKAAASARRGRGAAAEGATTAAW